MYYITYVKQSNEPLPGQMNFDEFYKSFFEGHTFPEPTPCLPRKAQYRTIEVDEISEAYKTRFAGLVRRFESHWTATLELAADNNMQSAYTTFKIPKHSGGTRTINAPNTIIKNRMANMLAELQNAAIYAHNSAYAYIQNRCTRDAIAVHQKTQNEWFLKMDLHDFFGSCNFAFIETQLKKLPFFALMHPTNLRNFIHFASLGDGLPQGSPLSPWITNQIMVEFDYRITKLAHDHNLTYTRYADDMLFSGKSKNAVHHAEEIVRYALQNTPLQLNTKKTRCSSIYGQNWNLGIMLNKDHNITIGYKKKERLRATIHQFCLNKAEWNSQTATELLGTLQYYRTIETEYIDELLTKYSQKYNMDVRSEIITIIKQGA